MRRKKKEKRAKVQILPKQRILGVFTLLVGVAGALAPFQNWAELRISGFALTTLLYVLILFGLQGLCGLYGGAGLWRGEGRGYRLAILGWIGFLCWTAAQFYDQMFVAPPFRFRGSAGTLYLFLSLVFLLRAVVGLLIIRYLSGLLDRTRRSQAEALLQATKL